ncbi:hypothetical protein RHGRI_002581 [Rhododendron griersonianum]|uniref:Uncharacterized protein n=1 Tax=Rhododendron griersonianum TaxID=479676 RepID=A0AAV6LPH7_9ERIC|nr:hypothetical protein RHGRI_002581 [Rhododendron griersonianum]
MGSMNNHPTTVCHVVAMPFPGRGHINPMMSFCNLLVSKSEEILITFVVTEEWLGFLGSEPKPANIRFATIPNVIHGSFLSVSRAQMDEIIAGVDMSGVRFLWVARGDASRIKEGCSADSDHDDSGFHRLANGYAQDLGNEICSIDLSDAEEEGQNNEGEGGEEEAASESEIVRAFREDESRRNAPLPPEAAARVVEAMQYQTPREAIPIPTPMNCQNTISQFPAATTTNAAKMFRIQRIPITTTPVFIA